MRTSFRLKYLRFFKPMVVKLQSPTVLRDIPNDFHWRTIWDVGMDFKRCLDTGTHQPVQMRHHFVGKFRRTPALLDGDPPSVDVKRF